MVAKGVFFSQVREKEAAQGAVKKVHDEIRAFENCGFDMTHVNFEPVSSGLRRTHIGKGICASLPFTYVFSKYSYDKKYDGYDFYYFRFEAADYWFVRFLRKLRQNNPGAKIIIEFPDFPNSSWKSLVYLPLLIKDVCARRKYKKYIDRFAVIHPAYNEIYGVRTVQYRNGIDVSRIPVKKACYDNGDQIHIIGVCTMFPSHGYDRFIISMARYYEDRDARKIIFHIVGDGPGPELKKYRKLVEHYSLDEYVIFEGRLTGEALYEMYDRCDIALELFAVFRKGLDFSSSLKSREYLAVGIPIISGNDIDVIKGKEFDYLLQYENNDAPVDLIKVVEFYDRVYGKESKEKVISNIRRFAEENCSFEATLKEVVDFISVKSEGTDE